MRSSRWFWLVALALPVTAGCYEARISNPDLYFLDVATDTAVPDTTPVDPGPAEVPDVPAEVPLDVPVGDVPLPNKDRPSGSPCENDGQCWTEFCITTDLARTLLGKPDITIPGGLCSLIGCSADDECGPGGQCLDTAQVSDGAPTLCVLPCHADSECRSEYECPDLGIKDASQAVVKTCLPSALVALIVCGNSRCEAWEQAHPGVCEVNECP